VSLLPKIARAPASFLSFITTKLVSFIVNWERLVNRIQNAEQLEIQRQNALKADVNVEVGRKTKVIPASQLQVRSEVVETYSLSAL
jgi:hypothetical protein